MPPPSINAFFGLFSGFDDLENINARHGTRIFLKSKFFKIKIIKNTKKLHEYWGVSVQLFFIHNFIKRSFFLKKIMRLLLIFDRQKHRRRRKHNKWLAQ
ncbi:MAG: hypothetical protein RL757_3169 [Bacteroidota bacterium]|jgi:hypothetical protein